MERGKTESSVIGMPPGRAARALTHAPRPVVLRSRRLLVRQDRSLSVAPTTTATLGSERDRIRVEEIPDAVGVAECSSGVVEATIVQRHPSLDERSGTVDMLREATGVNATHSESARCRHGVRARARSPRRRDPSNGRRRADRRVRYAARIASASASAASNSPMNASGIPSTRREERDCTADFVASHELGDRLRAAATPPLSLSPAAAAAARARFPRPSPSPCGTCR